MEAKLKEDYGRLYLSVTHNGYQWFSIQIIDPEKEIPILISVLQSYRQPEDSLADCEYNHKLFLGSWSVFKFCPGCGKAVNR